MVRIHFYKPHGILGRLVAWGTRSQFCHVAIEHKLYDWAVITQADPVKGVMISRPSMLHSPDLSIDIPWISDEIAVEILSQYWGIEYGWRDIVMFKIRPRWIPRHNHKGIICSELATLLLLQADTQLLTPPNFHQVISQLEANGQNPSDISPGQLAKILTGM